MEPRRIFLSKRFQSLSGFLLLALSFSFGFELLASRPDAETPISSCKDALISRTFGGERPEFSSSTLIPVGELIKTMKDPYLAKLHVVGELHEKAHPTPGLSHMFRTASSAADALVESYNVKAVRPEYPRNDLFLGAAATEALMLDPTKQPEFIRDAILIREGVVMIVPLLKRSSAKGAKPVYSPIIVKGHQKLSKEDDLRALFAAWALARSLGQYPPDAHVYLKPMAKVREVNNPRSPRPQEYVAYYYDVYDHIQEVEEIHRRYVEMISSPDVLEEIDPRRTTQAARSPWFSLIKEQLAEKSDLSMMPLPPTRAEAARLSMLGFSTMKELADLNVNSPVFLELAIQTGIRPDKLRYYIAHSRAATKDKPLLVEEFADPFAGVDAIAHVDFEDMMSRNLRSGVYLFGMKVENPKSRKKDKIVEEHFIWADDLKPGDIAYAWAQFIRAIKKSKYLKGKKYKITVYSHHEMTKFHQELDVVRARPEEFSASQRRSKYYWESEDGREGKLIRNTGFFRTYKDIKPQEVFAIMERIVDLYDYVRMNLAFPTYSNGLKHVIEYANPVAKMDVQFPDGQNGLESIEWAMRAYQTMEQDLFDRIEDYNRIDVDGNIAMTRLLRTFADREMDPGLRWREGVLEHLKQSRKAADLRRKADSLYDRSNLLEAIVGKQISEFTTVEQERLEEILDRTAYLEQRKAIDESPELERAEKEQELQRLAYEFRTDRKAQLLEFFEAVGGFRRDQATDEQLELLATFFLVHRVDDFSRSSFQRMIILERLIPLARETVVSIPRDPRRRIEIPDEWENALAKLGAEELLAETEVEFAQARDIWRGLYYRFAFPMPDQVQLD